MCTICGHFVQKGKIISSDIYDMLSKMAHRGPDAHGIYLDGKVQRAPEIDDLKNDLLGQSHIALGHSRLQIVGTERTSQPYTSCDGRLSLIHNGEIYNYQELRTLLFKKHKIKTSSDSEVIVHLLEEAYRGDLLAAMQKIVGLLDGMYAIAVTDGESVVVARDPIGKKPIYYIQNENAAYFASEKKALWNGIDEPKRLPPASMLCINDAQLEIHNGFQLQMPQIDIVDYRHAVEKYKEVLIRAIEKRLTGLTETCLGVIFSGGIDSVLVANLLQRAGNNVMCFCAGTENSADVKAALSVAQELGLELEVSLISEKEIEGILPEIIRNVEESGLLQVEVAVPMYLAAKAAAEHGVRVMFTGQAADELFAGYPWYKDVVSESGYLYLHEKLWQDLSMLYTDTLEREDKLTMAHSIELRAPYLDRDVIRTAMRISPRLKLRGEEDRLQKLVHRQAAVELGVPHHLAFRVKDPAQSGSGIHKIVEDIAAKHIKKIDSEVVDENIKRDKGSLYRYGDDSYGKSVARVYLQHIEDGIKKRYIPPFLCTPETAPHAN